MNRTDVPRRTLYRLSIWNEGGDEGRVWHGFVETAAEQRMYFDTLAELNQLLCELGGWMDPPLSPNKPGEPGAGSPHVGHSASTSNV